MVGLDRGLTPRQTVTVIARPDTGTERRFGVIARLDGPIDVEYYHGGGILPTVLRRLAGASASGSSRPADTKKPPGEEPGLRRGGAGLFG